MPKKADAAERVPAAPSGGAGSKKDGEDQSKVLTSQAFAQLSYDNLHGGLWQHVGWDEDDDWKLASEQWLPPVHTLDTATEEIPKCGDTAPFFCVALYSMPVNCKPGRPLWQEETGCIPLWFVYCRHPRR